MKVAALFSGGKDSTYAAYAAKKSGHSLECLVTANPKSEESRLFHYPNVRLAALQAQSAGIPHLEAVAPPDGEVDALISLLKTAASKYKVSGAVHGGIASVYQKERFEVACKSAGLEPVGPLWGAEPEQYMRSLIDSGFSFIITAVSAGGLDESWLGRTIDCDSLEDLSRLSVKYGFNLNFEGGEAETMVLDCPMFSRPVLVQKAKKVWDGYRGIFEIEEAVLGDRARWTKDKPAGGNQKDSQLLGN